MHHEPDPTDHMNHKTVLRRAALLFTLALLLSATAATSADAAKRRVPFGFFGSVLPPQMADPGQVSDAALEQQMALAARSGVETLRVTTAANALEPAQGVYDWTPLDRLVAAAARHRIPILLNVTEPTLWNVERPDDPEWRRHPPRDPGPYAELVRQLVLRYGPRGSFWAQNPTLPRTPIRQWQIWNEQTAPWHWDRQPWAPGYTALLRATYRAIKRADRRAEVVAGSLVTPRADYPPWRSIRDLYRAGAKRFFDVVSIHPFTHSPSVRGTVRQTVAFVRRVRAQMRRRRDGRKPIILTETTWPAAVGSVPRRNLLGFETTPRGQVLRLRAVYSRLARDRRRLGVGQVYWYAWATEYDTNAPASVVSFRYSGLTRLSGGAFSPMPVLRTYARVAARYEGCRKSSNARRCRG
jgi:polysaccharide biosynthesis protein PslG